MLRAPSSYLCAFGMRNMHKGEVATPSFKLAAIVISIVCFAVCGKINEALKVPKPDTVVEKTKDITENQKVFVETLFPDGTLSLCLKGEKGDTLLIEFMIFKIVGSQERETYLKEIVWKPYFSIFSSVQGRGRAFLVTDTIFFSTSRPVNF
jgi:hypothetical protein